MCGTLLLINSCFRAFFEAMQMYMLVSIIRSVLSSVIFIVPLILSYFGHYTIEDMLVFILCAYIISTLVYIIYFYFTYNGVFFKFNRQVFKKLFNWGKWLGIHSLLSPLLLYIDRFLIKSFLSISAVALYTIPFDLSARMSLISGSYTSSFYTAVSRWNKQKDVNLSTHYFKTLQSILIIISVVLIIGMLLSQLFLDLWISREFATKNFKILQILIFANFFNAINITSLRFLQGIGSFKFPIKIQLVLIPIYVFMLVSLMKYDILGVAFSFLIRMIIESSLLTSKVIITLNTTHLILKTDYLKVARVLLITCITSVLIIILT